MGRGNRKNRGSSAKSAGQAVKFGSWSEEGERGLPMYNINIGNKREKTIQRFFSTNPVFQMSFL